MMFHLLPVRRTPRRNKSVRNGVCMLMKSRIAIGAIAGALLYPSVALCAEAEPVEGSWFALIFYAINLLMFAWIVRRYGGQRIASFFRERARTIRDNRARAEKAYQEARELADRAAQWLQQLNAEKSRLAAELDGETRYQITQIEAAARDAVVRIQRDGELTVAAVREGAQRRLRQTIAEAAGRIARELVRRNLQPADQGRLLRGFIQRIGEETRG
jgi:F-type H+-transporting ATPase subunit b